MKVLFVSNEALTARRSGPAIRCVELARVVAQRHTVTLASLQACEVEIAGVSVISEALERRGELLGLARSCDVLLTQGMVLARVPWLAKAAKHLVVDLYDPYLLEYLAHAHPQHPTWGYLRQWHRLNQQMSVGDFFLCANERQWQYWLGRLCALGRLNPQEYERDPTFRSLLATVPFGLPEQSPSHSRQVLKGILPGIERDDFVLLWAGGIWQWLDPLTVIQAMKELQARLPKVKLLFLGAQDPNPNNRPMAMVDEAKNLAQNCGLLGKSVFFHEEWVPYEERQNFLLEADVGISAHPESIESRFAFRTRVLDYIWCGLPMILSSGDDFGDFVARENVGKAIAPADVAGWREAMSAIAEDTEFRRAAKLRLAELAKDFQWERVAEPLLRYCEAPHNTHKLSGFRSKLVPLLSSGYELAKGLR